MIEVNPWSRRAGGLALADADAARDAHRDESCNQSKQYFLHWNSPFFTPRDTHFVPRCTVGRPLKANGSPAPQTVGHFKGGLCPWGHSYAACAAKPAREPAANRPPRHPPLPEPLRESREPGIFLPSCIATKSTTS